ncbi:hypothetical protein BDY24DRAFT_358262 [Mrakia frigida]|uniref:uncharacterized protein n=1 Tax=Mrakia frigida TaxID=29902 RepID=UPI003FCBFD68
MLDLPRIRRRSTGDGVYANEDVKKDAAVVEYTGERISEEERDKRESQCSALGQPFYSVTMGDGTVVDATYFGNIARWVKHGCDPNVSVEEMEGRNGEFGVVLFALRDISSGEELLWDYSVPEEEGRVRTVCTCGSEKCRGYID